MPDDTAFPVAYRSAFRHWERQPEPSSVQTPYGRTEILSLAAAQASASAPAPPVVMLHGGGATSAVWSGLAPALARDRSVAAVDIVGDVGASVPSQLPLKTAADVVAWLDAVLDVVTVHQAPAVLLGHSYGAWLATTYALARPERLAGLVLLDPTAVVAMQRASVLVRVLPELLGWIRRTPERVRAEIERELAGAPVPGWWLDLVVSAASESRQYPTTKPPGKSALGELRVRTLVVMAGRSGMHDVAKVGQRCRAWLPDVDVVTDPAATHYSMPFDADGVVARSVDAWLRDGAVGEGKRRPG